MRRALQILALLIAISSILVWIATGANRGWTKTSMEVKTVDEITGIEGIDYKKAFLPGLDFLGSALLGAGILAGVSLFVRKQTKINS